MKIIIKKKMDKIEYEKLRQSIIKKLSDYFYKKSYISTCWLWGSDANNENDEYSDIDLFFCVDDYKFDEIFIEIKNTLLKIWELDFESDIQIEWKQLIKFFHINWTPESLIIDIWIIKKSDWIIFENWHPYFKPKVLFDKNNIIKFKDINEKELIIKIEKFIKIQKDLVLQSSRIKTYINRRNYIEATNYYIRFMYLPLISILRLKYTPYLYNWWRIHISRHFPIDTLEILEKLMKFNSISDIENNLNISRKLFLEIEWEIKKEWINLKN